MTRIPVAALCAALLMLLSTSAAPRAADIAAAQPQPEQLQQSSAHRWAAPIVPLQVVRPFEPPPQPWAAGHRGIDIAAAPGIVVTAAGSGVVRYADWLVDRGVVAIEHPNG